MIKEINQYLQFGKIIPEAEESRFSVTNNINDIKHLLMTVMLNKSVPPFLIVIFTFLRQSPPVKNQSIKGLFHQITSSCSGTQDCAAS